MLSSRAMLDVKKIGLPSPFARATLPPAALLALVAVIYGRATGFEFTHWDDGTYVVDNPVILSLGASHIHAAFTHFFMGNYAPLHILSYAVDYKLWGLDPFGYHVSNIILHGLNVLALFFLVRRIDGRDPVAWVAAALFAIHPVNVETVAWVAQRKTLLAQFFFFLSFHEYLRYAEGKGKESYFLSLAFFVLSLLSKVSAITLPLLLLLYDICYRERSGRGLVLNKIPFFLLSGLFAGIALIAQSSAYHGTFAYHGGSALANGLTVLVALARYLLSLVYPADLSAYYYFSYRSVLSYPVLGSLLLLSLIGFFLYCLRRHKGVLFWSGWFYLALIPNLQIIPLDAVMADRYLYLPAIGAFVLSAAAWMQLRRAGWKGPVAPRVIDACGLVALALLAILSYQRVGVWQDDSTLWSDTVRKDPSPVAYNNLAAYWGSIGEQDKAEEALNEALRLNPDDFMATKNMGKLLAMRGNFGEAARYLIRASHLETADEDVRLTLASVYLDQGNIEDSRRLVMEILRRNPDSRMAREQLRRIEERGGSSRR